jgi:hypothetical protein
LRTSILFPGTRFLPAGIVTGILAVICSVAPAHAGQALIGHVPRAVATSRMLRRVPAPTRLNMAIGLPLRNQETLDSLLEGLADPSSPNYHRYLTPEQFAEQFGPTEDDYKAVIAFAESQGLAVTGTHSNRMLLDVTGAVADVEKAFHLNMMIYQHPVRGQFYAPDREPSLDLDVKALDIAGLDNFEAPRPMALNTLPVSMAKALVTGSGPSGLFIGKDFRAAYAPGVTLDGTGQVVGLLEFDGFYASDLAANFKQAGLPAVPTQTVLLDGFNGAPGSANIEVILDIAMAGYMAPGVSKIMVYEGYTPNDMLNRMATDNLAQQLSSSWGFGINATTEQIFKQFIAQGQSLYQASGDSGAYKGAVMPPSDDPNVTVVGGTSLSTSGADGPWQSEGTWSGSGGGISTAYPIPSYQQGVGMAANGGSLTMRNIPDVSLTADIQMFLICNNGQGVSVGGTSAAAPLWAGFNALANQKAAANGKPRVGFVNPIIYAVGKGTNYLTDFHDISLGNNAGFSALAGYDLATGWGTPAGQHLIDDLSGVSSQPGFSLSASQPSLSINPGGSGISTVTVTQRSGFTGTVALVASGMPAGVTALFSPASTTSKSTLTFVASSAAAAGTSTITLTGTSGTLKNTATINLVIAVPSFSLTASASSITMNPGSSVGSTITVGAQNGFTGSVALVASGMPTGVTASFSPASTTSTSTVTFAAGIAAVAGTSTITLTGTSGALKSTTTINVVIIVPSFSLTASPASVTVKQGSSAGSAITVVPQNGFMGNVSLAASGLPAGVTASFSPPSTLSASTVTFAAGSAGVAGTAAVTITGTSGTLKSTVTVTLTTVVPNFSLTASTAALSVPRSTSAGVTMLVGVLNGFSANVTLAASGLPAGVTASFSPASTAATSVLTLTASSSAAAATSTITVTGTSGSLSHTATIALTVIAPSTGTTLVSLASAANVTAMVTDGTTFAPVALDAGLNGVGTAYSTNLVGTQQTLAGTTLYLGLADVPDAVSSKTIPLPAGQFSTVKLLATAVNGSQTSQTFTVTYTDGTTSSFVQSLSDWFTPQNFSGESKVLSMAYRDTSNGVKDNRTFLLYGYSFNLNAAKKVSSITLPNNRNVVVLAVSLGAATTQVATPVAVNLSPAFDTAGITSDGKAFTGGLDGVGYAYSRTLLGTNSGIFTFGPADAPDVVSGGGKVIALPTGGFSGLQILATGVNGSQTAQTFKVTYTDGTSTVFTQSLSDWFKPQTFPGESNAVTMAHRNSKLGSPDNGPYYLYGYTFALNSSKTVSTFTLPGNGNVKVLAAALLP